jgi:NAD-dependent SIR2 family protein deacetylase
MHSDTVLFLGAGASQPFGIAVTGEILELILKVGESIFDDRPGVADDECLSEEERASWETISWREHIKSFPDALDPREPVQLARLLKDRLRILLPGLDQVGTDLPLITDVLSLIDYMLASGIVSSPRFQPASLEELRVLLERAILQVLSRPSKPDLATQNDATLAKLADWICQRGESGRPVTIISTNYDIALENKIYSRLRLPVHEAVDLGFSWREPTIEGLIHHPPERPVVRIFKLHGSLNWLRCGLCGYIYFNSRGSIYHQAFRKTLDWSNSCHCLHGPLRPVIVAPSMVRHVQDANLLSIWQRALEALRNAQSWIIIGYSLPPEDLAIRSILIRGERTHEGPLNIKVIQNSSKTRSSYQLLFPDLNEADFHVGGFLPYVPELVRR